VVPIKGSSGRRTPCPHEPWQRMVNAMLLLTGSITFLNFTLYGFMVSPSGGPASCER